MSFKVDALSPAWRYFLSLFPEHPELFSDLEKRVGYSFQSPGYLCEAMTHRSAIYEIANRVEAHNSQHLTSLIRHNEKLEFLGDSLLSLAISTWLWHHKEQQSEGEFSRMRASLVRESSLAQIAQSYHIGSCLLLGRAAATQGGRHQPTLLADALEAFFGAVYLDGGLAAASAVVELMFSTKLHSSSPEEMMLFDHKTRLQELTQQFYGCLPSYHLRRQEGPDHNKNYVVECRVQDEVVAVGLGKSKKKASQHAAQQALQKSPFSTTHKNQHGA